MIIYSFVTTGEFSCLLLTLSTLSCFQVLAFKSNPGNWRGRPLDVKQTQRTVSLLLFVSTNHSLWFYTLWSYTPALTYSHQVYTRAWWPCSLVIDESGFGSERWWFCSPAELFRPHCLSPTRSRNGYHSKWFEPRSISSLSSVTVRVNVLLK